MLRDPLGDRREVPRRKGNVYGAEPPIAERMAQSYPPPAGVANPPASSSGLPPPLPAQVPPPIAPPAGAAPVPSAPPKPATTMSEMPRLLKATYLTEGETLLYERRPTRWHYLVKPTLVFVLILFFDLILYLSVYSPSSLGTLGSWLHFLQASPGSTQATLELIVAVFLLLVGVLYFGVCWLEYARTVYVVTSTRLIRQKGILSKNFDEVQLTQVRGVLVVQGILNRILRYGTVRVSAEFGGIGGNAPGNEDWPGVVHPMDFEQIVERAQERLRGVYPATPYTPNPSPPTPPR
jgi:hypothetical protein